MINTILNTENAHLQGMQKEPQSHRAIEPQSHSVKSSNALINFFKSPFRMLIAILLLFQNVTFAQLIGWPSAVWSPEVDFTSASISTDTYLDNDRARVISESLVSTTPLVYDLQLSSITGSSFIADKWCAVIQMTGTGVGFNCMIKTISYNSGTDVMRIEVLPGNTWPTFDFATASRIQLVRIPVYWDLTINSGEITCHPFDYSTGTGGFMPLIIGNQITINGGYFNASNKGYINDWVGGTPTLGVGGIGANPLTYGPGFINGFGYSGGMYSKVFVALNPDGNICFNGIGPPPILPTFNLGTVGEIGDGPNNAGLTGTITNTANEIQRYPTISPLTSFYNSILRMGNSGDAGIGAGTGGGAGGAGGLGGNNGAGPLGFFPGTRNLGDLGGNGGNPALGGRGGGVMYFKFANTAISNDIATTSGYKLFFSNGENGGNGEQGENGGDGGYGLAGQNGVCIPPTTLGTTGGWGGFGMSGIGAGGGDGGRGGQPGTIWVVKKLPGTHPSSLKTYFRVRGGQGGGGGMGGYSKIYESFPRADNYVPTLNNINYPCLNGVDYSICPPPPVPCNTIVCDCDKVFKHWGEEGLFGYTVDATTNPLVWELIFNSTAPSIYFDVSSKYLYYDKIIGTCTTRYNCYMVKEDVFLDIMKKAYQVSALETYVPTSSMGNNILGTDNATYNSGTGITQINFTFHNVLEYDPATDILKDDDNPGKRTVIAQNCDINYSTEDVLAGGGGGGGGGETPQTIKVKYQRTGPQGTNAPDELDGNDPDNMGEEDGGARILIDNDGEVDASQNFKEIANVVVGPMHVSVELKQHEIKNWQTCSLYSLDGKLISTKTIENGKTEFNQFATGIYLLKFSGNGFTLIQKVIIR